MKTLMTLLLLLGAHVSFANVNYNENYEAAELEELLEMNSAAMQPNMSYYTCYARAQCANGDEVSCITYGSQTVYGHQQSGCTWYSQPGVGVRCTGYQQRQDQWGNFFWAWVDIPVRCPPRGW